MADNIVAMPLPRMLKSAPASLGLYLRPGRSDHKVLLDVMAAGQVPWFGMVFDPTDTMMARHRDLRAEMLKHHGEVVLDPKTQQSALPGSITEELAKLPWGSGRMHTRADFQGASRTAVVAALGKFTTANGFSAVLAPTDVLKSVDDPWLSLDLESARNLRLYLDLNSGKNVALFYSLALPYAAFRNPKQRAVLVEHLKGLPVSTLWLKVEGVGAASTANALRNYIDAAAELHQLGIPLVADQMGGIPGLALLAFGAVGGMSHGITLGETFSAASWRKPPTGKKFGQHHRVHLADIDLMMKRQDAEALFGASVRARTMLGCRDTDCCGRGIDDMVQQAGRHFLNRRTAEIVKLSRIPEHLRPLEFLNRIIVPATELIAQAAKTRWKDRDFARRVTTHRKRVDSIRIALTDLLTAGFPRSSSQAPKTRAGRS